MSSIALGGRASISFATQPAEVILDEIWRQVDVLLRLLGHGGSGILG